MRDSINEVRESLTEEVAKLRAALRQAARSTEMIATLEARLIELERQRTQNETIRTKQRLNEAHAKPLSSPLPACDRMVRMKELKVITGLATSSIYKMISEGRFPKPAKLGERAVAWRHSELIAWLEALE
jgi:prophage regulatory protein